MPIFTLTFCALILVIYILDNFIVIPKTETVTLKEKLWTGHNKGYINHALHLSEKKIKKRTSMATGIVIASPYRNMAHHFKHNRNPHCRLCRRISARCIQNRTLFYRICVHIWLVYGVCV